MDDVMLAASRKGLPGRARGAKEVGLRSGMREVIAMWESVVGLIGMALIVYLLVAIVRPEKF